VRASHPGRWGAEGGPSSNYTDPDITLSAMISGKIIDYRFKKDQLLCFDILSVGDILIVSLRDLSISLAFKPTRRCSPLCLMKGIDESPVLVDDGADRHGTVGHVIQNLEDRLWNLVDALHIMAAFDQREGQRVERHNSK
jgi:hypothetical protein